MKFSIKVWLTQQSLHKEDKLFIKWQKELYNISNRQLIKESDINCSVVAIWTENNNKVNKVSYKCKRR